jgi:hypothetical protein
MYDWVWLSVGGVVFAAVLALLVRFGLIQKGNAAQWLIYAVVEAERALGSGTGQLKLRWVYDLFAGKFPLLSRFLSFSVFSGWVDAALDEMKRLLVNKSVKSYVEGGADNG